MAWRVGDEVELAHDFTPRSLFGGKIAAGTKGVVTKERSVWTSMVTVRFDPERPNQEARVVEVPEDALVEHKKRWF